MIRRLLLPPGVDRAALPVLVARMLRAFADGYVAILLPAYLLALGLDTWKVGLLSTATLLGSALATLAVGAWGHAFHHRSLLLAATLMMAVTGFAFAGLSDFWPLLLVAFLGTLNPSSGDVSVFLPLEHSRLAEAAAGNARTALFARYGLIGALFAAVGALAAAVPDWLVSRAGLTPLASLRWMFVLYGFVGVSVWGVYRRLPAMPVTEKGLPARRLGGDESPRRAGRSPTRGSPLWFGPSRNVVMKLAALFSVDAFAGGLVVNALLSLWLFQRFGLSLKSTATFFFWAGTLIAVSQLAAPWVARRIGLINTMVFTHLPANICLIVAALSPRLDVALGLLLLRALLSQMDVPTRSAFVMAVVTPAERAAAASFTNVPRSLAAAISPSLGGALFSAGWLAAPLVACGLLKIAYDLTLWRMFRKVTPES